jgi:cyanate permease
VALTLAAVIAVLTVRQAIRQDSWEPIWLAGWIPAVLVATCWMPARRRRRPSVRNRGTG